MIEYVDVQRRRTVSIVAAGVVLLLWPTSSFAANFLSLTTMNDVFKNLSQHETEIIRLIVATAYITGFFLVFAALHGLKKVGRNMGSMMGMQEGMSGPLVKMICGILLIYLPSTIRVGLQTVWGSNASILKYTSSAGDQFGSLKSGMVTLMHIIGYISLIRGMLILSRAAGGNSNMQQGGLGKGFLGVFGGILAINVVGTVKLVGSVLGIDLL